MPEYGTCECYACSLRVPKPQAHRVTIEREKGHSSGNFRISRRSTSFYTGRTYYAKQDIWLCNNCYSAYVARQLAAKKRNRIALAALIFIGLVIFAIAQKGSEGGIRQTHAVNDQFATSPTQTANAVQKVDVNNSMDATPRDPKKAQNRLIELGYMNGPADGVWGNKSRTALRAFKAANGLVADDKWDAAVNSRLYSLGAARAPIPLASSSPPRP